MTTSLSSTEAARRFSDLLNRVRYRGETFVIVRNGEEVAKLTAVEPGRTSALRHVLEKLAAVRSGDPGFTEDLERIQAEQPPVGDGPWAS